MEQVRCTPMTGSRLSHRSRMDAGKGLKRSINPVVVSEKAQEFDGQRYWLCGKYFKRQDRGWARRSRKIFVGINLFASPSLDQEFADQFRRDFTFIISTMIEQTTRLPILPAFRNLSINRQFTALLRGCAVKNISRKRSTTLVFGMVVQKVLNGINHIMRPMFVLFGNEQELLFVSIAGENTPQITMASFAPINAKRHGGEQAGWMTNSEFAKILPTKIYSQSLYKNQNLLATGCGAISSAHTRAGVPQDRSGRKRGCLLFDRTRSRILHGGWKDHI